MDLVTLKRRVEMLDAVSTGLHPSVVVAQLASKYGISERALWSDWQRRKSWVPFVLGLGRFAGFAEEVGQKLDAVQRAAWSLYLKAGNDSARVGALRTVLEALGLHSELVQMKEVAERLEKLEDAIKRQSRARRFG